MLQEHQTNLDSPHTNQENLLFSTPSQVIRNHSPMSKSDIRFDNRIQMLKSNSSPRKEHLQQEISKLRDHSKKLLDMIDSMGKREAEKNKKIQSQNMIISDLKQRLIQQTMVQTNENSENNKRNEDENEVFIALLDELRVKQDEIELLQQRMCQMEETVKSIQLAAVNSVQSQQEQVKEQIQVDQEQNSRNEDAQEENKEESDILKAIQNNESEIIVLKQKAQDQELQMRKNIVSLTHLTDSNKSLTHRVKTIESEKGAGLRSFLSFLKELFLIVVISALFSGLKYYISII